MKTTSKLLRPVITSLLVVGVAILALQHRYLTRSNTENHAFKQRVDQLMAENDRFKTEVSRLSQIIPRAPSGGASLPKEQTSELLRLRGEIGRLRSLERETEQLRREQMQSAQTKVSDAQAEFERLEKLHADNLVSAPELDRAKFALDLLKAKAKGDATEGVQVRLRHASKELERASELYRQNLISDAEYNGIQDTVLIQQA